MIAHRLFVLAAAGGLAANPSGAASAPLGAPSGFVIAVSVPKAGLPRAQSDPAPVDPAGERFVNAGQVHAWSEGTVYRLSTAPGTVSDIALEPGEALISVAAGDTARWVIGDTASGSGPAKRTHVLVKPFAAGLRTNLVIATDRRIYLIELQSLAAAPMATLSWRYPQDDLLALRKARDESAAAAPVAADIAVESLNFNYRIEGDSPDWRPVRAFDDGRQVFIEFPQSISTVEAPPLFVAGSSGEAELVNYRLRGRYYVVDRLFAAAELRLGSRRQQVVRIVRVQAGPRRRGRAS